MSVALHATDAGRLAQDVVAALTRLGVKPQRMTVDSRTIVAGDVFVAIPGSRVDGRGFVGAALAQGAAAVLRERRDDGSTEASDPRVIDVDGLSEHLGEIADCFYGHPSRALRVFGVTGTNGKTSIANWLAQAFDVLGQPCGVIGTLGVSFGGHNAATSNTTPDAAHVHTILRDLRAAGAKAVAMEVSSHALELGRVGGVQFDAVVFTNLTQDHLDFHGTMEAYGAAKSKLFTAYPAQHRIVNADDAWGRKLLDQRFPGTLAYGLEHGDVVGTVELMKADGMRLRVRFGAESVLVDTPLIGRFNAYNLLAVAATLLASKVPLQRVGSVLAQLHAAPGRMQRVNAANLAFDHHADLAGEPAVYVDYAHTPDALAKALDTVRETAPRVLSVVFGCGGDRDRRKRPLMGAIAAARADRVYVTSDNPRSEPPEAIIDEVLAGVDGAQRGHITRVAQRREAIRMAIAHADARDAVLIAGKGHETYQEIAGVRHDFSDVTEAHAALAARNGQALLGSGGAHRVVR